jgi:hypothetical protein
MIQRIRRSRMFGWDRNPLRRRVDRGEAGILAALIIVLLVGAPILVPAAGHWARAAGMQTLRAQATWSQVSATVARAAPTQSGKFPGALGAASMWASWTAPDGQPRSGWIAISPGVTVGNTTSIWVSRSGSPTGAPRERAELLGWTPIAEVAAAIVLAFIFFLAVRLQRWLFERRRLACWHRAWRAQEPRWTGRR